MIGDINSQEIGSGARSNEGKPDYSLIPLHLLEPVVRVMEHGAEKYAPWNWAKGMKWSVITACQKRHMAAYDRGETLDRHSGQSHQAHIAANALFLLHYEEKHQQLDDRPKQWFLDADSTDTGLKIAGECVWIQKDMPYRMKNELEIWASGCGHSQYLDKYGGPCANGLDVCPHCGCEVIASFTFDADGSQQTCNKSESQA